MKNLFLLFLFFAGGTALAQPVQTLYYENGKKYMEGHWTITKNYLFESVERLTISVREERQHNSGEEDFFIPDADEEMLYTNGKDRRQQTYDMMGVVFDGPLNFWYASGGKQLQVEYQRGIVQGPFREYYPTGGVLQTGILEKGMANGPWSYFYKSGKPFYTGTYKAYPPAELEQQWAGSRMGRKMTGAAQKWVGRSLLDWTLKPENKKSALVASAFSPFYEMLLTGTLKEGSFTFWQKSGAKWAEMVFKEDLPIGTWRQWREGRQEPIYTIEWEQNQVLFATDSMGRRQKGTAVAEEITQATIAKETERVRKMEEDIRNQFKPTEQVPQIFTLVDQMPQFPGDIKAWIAENMRYPPAAKAAGTEGRVVVRITVQPDGRITDAKVEKGVQPDLDAEALRLVNAMPPWSVPTQNGKPVSVYFRVPVNFSLK